MEPNLIFYGPWTIEVTELVLGVGAPTLRVTIERTGGAPETYVDPPVGTRLNVNAEQWVLATAVSFDMQPFQSLTARREFNFDSNSGMVALVDARLRSPNFWTIIRLRCTAHDPELRARPTDHYDFTFRGGTHRRGRAVTGG